MTIMHMDKKFGDLRKYPQLNLIESTVMYVIDSKYRKSVNLVFWLKEQLNLARANTTICATAESLIGDDDDDTMRNVWNYVHSYKIWRSDDVRWKQLEKWEDVITVYENTYCDCESGSLLMYCLARLAGITEDALYLGCGYAADKTGDTFGHCWLLYKPLEYPLNYVFMDWCFEVSPKLVKTRDKYTIVGQNIYCYRQTSQGEYYETKSRYVNLWFAFNEKKSFRYFR